MTLHLNVQCVVYLESLVIAEHLDHILFCHYSKILKIFFEYESLVNLRKFSNFFKKCSQGQGAVLLDFPKGGSTCPQCSTWLRPCQK